MSNESVFIIDTFSLMFQVFHAIPAMTGTQGQPTNAVFGLTRDLYAILDRKPTYLFCAMDSAGPGHRNGLYDAYKANRVEMPEDLRPQIPLVKELLAGFRIPAIEFERWEADDVIATISEQASARGLDVVIVSNDKDIRQLLSPQVRLLNCRKNEFLDEAGLMNDWGIRPDQVVDYQSLVGDSVDNVPGVPKIGPKTARGLIERFGTLDEILNNADKAPGRVVQQNLRQFADQARVSRELVRLRRDLPLEVDFDAARVSEPDRATLFDLFTRLGFRRYASLMRMESDPANVVAESAALNTTLPDKLTLISDMAALQVLTESLTNEGQIYLDIAVTGRLIPDRRLTTADIGTDGGQSWRIIVDTRNAEETPDLNLCLLQWLAQYSGEIVIADAKPLLQVMLNFDCQPSCRIFDTSIADYLLDAGARSHELSEVADRHADSNLLHGGQVRARNLRQKTMFDDIPSEAGVLGDTQTEIHASDQIQKRLSTLRTVTTSLRAALSADSLLDLYESIERPLIHVLAMLEHTGVAVDVQELKNQSQQAVVGIEQLTAEVFAAAGMTFNVDSPKQLSDVLFKRLQLPVLKKTRTGSSTDQEVLEQLALLHPLPAKIIERRHLTKLKGTYLDALPELAHAGTGRIHATFHQTVAATGRLSSSDPNLQNIPIRTEEGRRIRRAFRPGFPDWYLVCADYSQIELRVLAHFSDDPALKEAFSQGIDIHAAVASDVFQVPVEQVSSEQRRVAKAVNFGVIYGQSAFGLANALKIDKSEAAKFIDSYFQRYQGVARFCERVLEETASTGFARTILNRRRAITGIRSTTGIQRNMPERTAINTVIQGSAADLIKKAMIEVSQQLTTSGLRASMLLQIHDELVFEVHADDRQQLTEIIVPGMQNAMKLQVPLVVDVSWGPNWLDQQDL